MLYNLLRITTYYNVKGEWVYKDIQPKIICEKYLEDDTQKLPNDYKFYCFYGDPKFILVVVDRYSDITKAIYDDQWNLQPFIIDRIYPYREIPKPPQLDLMLKLARKLSAGINFCRVDLYNVHNDVIFGEITFYSLSGFYIIIPEDYDLKIGAYLDLSKKLT
jgi:hypothetical protein